MLIKSLLRRRVLTPASVTALNTAVGLSVNLAVATTVYLTLAGVENAAITAAQTRVRVTTTWICATRILTNVFACTGFLVF